MNLHVEIFLFNVWVIVYLLSISEKIRRNDMLFWNSKAKYPTEKTKAEKEIIIHRTIHITRKQKQRN